MKRYYVSFNFMGETKDGFASLEIKTQKRINTPQGLNEAILKVKEHAEKYVGEKVTCVILNVIKIYKGG